ncbi:hypothetical protein [Vibrio ouci]|uniref:hypothetical protein n=1 Tax=Vibrio ouci TaxID=2499078 RepID=UPI001ABFF7C1|nr:hypothetical protein [Vibrio ouci]
MDVNGYIGNTEFTELANNLLDIKEVPDDIAGNCKFVQGNLIHSYWLEHYGVEVDQDIKLTEMQIRSAQDFRAGSHFVNNYDLIGSNPQIDIDFEPHRTPFRC